LLCQPYRFFQRSCCGTKTWNRTWRMGCCTPNVSFWILKYTTAFHSSLRYYFLSFFLL
jgi:hypothetical protein